MCDLRNDPVHERGQAQGPPGFPGGADTQQKQVLRASVRPPWVPSPLRGRGSTAPPAELMGDGDQRRKEATQAPREPVPGRGRARLSLEATHGAAGRARPEPLGPHTSRGALKAQPPGRSSGALPEEGKAMVRVVLRAPDIAGQPGQPIHPFWPHGDAPAMAPPKLPAALPGSPASTSLHPHLARARGVFPTWQLEPSHIRPLLVPPCS